MPVVQISSAAPGTALSTIPPPVMRRPGSRSASSRPLPTEYTCKVRKLRGADAQAALYRTFVRTSSPLSVLAGDEHPPSVLKTSFRSIHMRARPVDPMVPLSRDAVVYFSGGNDDRPGSAPATADPELPAECLGTPPPTYPMCGAAYSAEPPQYTFTAVSTTTAPRGRTSILGGLVGRARSVSRSRASNFAASDSPSSSTTPIPPPVGDCGESDDPTSAWMGVVRITSVQSTDAHDEVVTHHCQFAGLDPAALHHPVVSVSRSFELIVRAVASHLRAKRVAGSGDPAVHELVVHVPADDVARRLAMKRLAVPLAGEYVDPLAPGGGQTVMMYAVELQAFFSA
ncbi:hypothetical protein H9P43_009938 [Blastocladiella emersonii ATCC 22665]|nr:hypothetical protein H9P43_009938 [Blastocladiella emersonii ATCC 22665]